MSEPVITWNLFVTPLCVAILALLVKRWLDHDREGWKMYEETKQKELTDWRLRFTDTLCSVKKKVDEIQIALTDKVTWNEHGKMDDDLQELSTRLTATQVGLDDLKENCRRNHG